VRALAALLFGLLAAPAAAHNLTVTDVLVVLSANGNYQVDVHCDLDALALGVDPSLDALEVMALYAQLDEGEKARRVEALEPMFQRRIRLRFDGETAIPDVAFPDVGTQIVERSLVPTVLGTTARLTGRVPTGAKALTVAVSRGFPQPLLTVLDQRSLRGVSMPLGPGEESPPFPLDGTLGVTPESTPSVVGRYVVLGFEHILPKGLDHILFILGLFLLSARLRPLLLQVSAFTLAHTVTLALAATGVVALPARLVEPLIALSIAYVAIENLLTEKLHAWRPMLVFAFGLLHGLGFAGVLAELGFPADRLWPALLSFNVGVELGQLTVLALAFLSLGLLRDKPWYRRRVVVPACVAIAALGLFWAVERALG
jgi:hypothetical protein